jgi:hypothetical protein
MLPRRLRRDSRKLQAKQQTVSEAKSQMFRLVEWPARRDGALARDRGSPVLGRRCAWLRIAVHLSIAALALATPFGALAQDVPLGPHVRIKGLPAGVTLSGGQTNAERDWVVPLRGRGALKIDIPPCVAGNVDLTVALVGDNGDALAERGVALRVKAALTTTANSNPLPSSARTSPSPRR